MNARLSLLGLALIACARQQPQVMTPVRIDAPKPILLAPEAETTTTRRVVRSADDDPFFRADRLEWPGPNRYRDGSGAPGPDYWQQRADYTIAATLDTAAQAVSGQVTIRYTNNSPDTLRHVWLQLDQNLYRTGSKGSVIYPAESRWGVRGFEGGYEIRDLTVDGRGSELKVNDTMGRIDLAAPLAPKGGTITIAMRYSFKVPEHGSDRMGRDGTLYQLAQWYPRMAVYDDVRGWNTDPYLGQGEFYLEYGDIDYAVTVPTGYTVAGSGVLQNAADVLTSAQRGRLARAAQSASVVQIITADESKPAAKTGTKTWRFRAQRVRDVAWAAAPDFRWDATSWNGIVTQAYYPWPRAGKAWESGAEQTQWSIRTYSQLIYPYPYPQATSVAGPVGGMEYPMFVMVHYGTDDPMSIFGTIDHEQGHEWFPMIVGSNERRYAWQDEGFNTYINAFSNERRVPGLNAFPTYAANWRAVHQNGTESPLMTPPDRIVPEALGAIGYRKPGATLLALRNGVLGMDTFDRAMREYARRWAFKHPTPADFFRTVEDVSGEDLSWFWKGFFYTTDALDLGITNVETKEVDGRRVATVTITRGSSLVFPPSFRLRLADGSTQDARFPVQIWSACGAPVCNRVQASVAVRAPVTGARLWPQGNIPDFNPANDSWGSAPPAEAGPSTSGGLATPIGGGAAKP